MDRKELERIKGLSREERVEFFNKHKDEVLALNADDLAAVNGGLWWNNDDSVYKPKPHENPDTDCPYRDCSTHLSDLSVTAKLFADKR